MAGPYETFFLALQASVYMTGVTMAFGEEMIAAQDVALPSVVMVPRGGPAQEPGYARDGSATDPQDIDVYTDDLWEFGEIFQFYCRAKSNDPTRQKPLHHHEATRALRLLLLSALRDQRAMSDGTGAVFYGLSFKALRSDWESMQDTSFGRTGQPFDRPIDRFARALVLSVQVNVPEVMAPPTQSEVTVETTQFTPSINNQPG